MERILTAEQMRVADSYTISNLGVSEEILVERAGIAVAEEIMCRFQGGRVLVCVGKGNNGADGKVVARLLSKRHGFNVSTLSVHEVNFEQFDNELKAVLSYIKDTGYEIPVIAAGGIYTRDDLLHYLELGAAGIQMSTRFVTTYECDAHNAYKQCYIDARKEDIVLTDSPVGMPGRAIRNQFLERVKTGERMVGKCRQCIKQCRPDQIPYCITQALINSVEGRVQDGLIVCGENAYRADRMEHVADIMKEFAL